MYYISQLVIIILFTYISIRYGLNYLSALPVRNSPVQAIRSIGITSFTSSYTILKCIYVRNSLSFNFSSKYLLIDSNLTFTTLILLILFSNVILFSISQLTISYSYPTVIGCYKLVSTILVSLPNLKVVTAVNSVIASAFSGILFDFFYRNLSSEYITKPYSRNYGGLINRLGIQVQNS